jgi:hypothetical protein
MRRASMTCSCGEQYKKIFPATVDYAVHFDADRKTSPLRWTQEDLCVCIGCGETRSLVPGRELLELKAGGGESAA